jgi:hypothetical protein
MASEDGIIHCGSHNSVCLEVRDALDGGGGTIYQFHLILLSNPCIFWR